jgi:hypothetical protein
MVILSFIKTKLSRVPKWLVFPMGILLTCVLASVSLFFFLERPQYIELEAMPPNNQDWYYTETATQDWGTSRYFISRRETYIWGCGDCLMSWQSIIEYFDKSLTQEGWHLTTDGNNPCAFTPEANFLERGKGYLVYKRLGSQPYGDSPAVCIALWPLDTSSADSFPLVLSSINPSFLTVLYDGLD